MGPELSSNPPLITKRKKHLDKKHSSASVISETANMFNYVQGTFNTHNTSSNSVYDPQPPTFYPMMNYPANNYQLINEPMSLPVYGAANPYRNMSSTNPFANNNIHQQSQQYNMKIPSLFDSTECKSLPIFDQNDDLLKRRFSDPGLPNDSDSSLNSYEGKLVQKLTQQVQGLKDSNRKLNREVNEMRMEITMLKQQLHARHFDREYEPGMLADIIREVRDAARVREDALLARVKHMIEEKQISMSHFNVITEKNRHNDRLSKLEDQMKNISMSNNSRSEDSISLPSSSTTIEENPSTARQVLELERETLQLRRELQDTRAKKDESDLKVMQLGKQLSMALSSCETNTNASETSDENGKSGSLHSSENVLLSATATPSTTNSTNTTAANISGHIYTNTSMYSNSNNTPKRITLSGPVTDL